MNTLKPNEIQYKLTKEQKSAVGLLSIGTFLEYFDLMLYVHMAVLLNELFFPQTDPYTTRMLSALSFCSTFVFRPVGALFFGWIGDNIGRKATIILTTTIMAGCCAGMAILPTYAQIGITASYLMITCRILQGMSSMGEIVGAELYLTETVKPPIQYPTVAAMGIFTSLGATAALYLSSLVTSDAFSANTGLTWRIGFGIGAVVALIGTIARSTLREVPDFVDARKIIQSQNLDIEVCDKLSKINKKTLIAYFFIQCARPVGFYFIYVHCANILDSLGLSSHEIINHNFIVSVVDLVGIIVIVFLSYRIYPLKIIRTILKLFMLIIVPIVFFFPEITSSTQLLFIQCLSAVLLFDHSSAIPIFYRHFPLLRRFTSVSVVYAMSRAVMYIITSFGAVYLVEQFGNRGILIIIIPTAIAFYISLNYFQKLEIASGNHPDVKN